MPVIMDAAPHKPCISVVVVTYNNDDLADMAARVLAEPETAELILVDNGNSPRTEAWLHELAGREARVQLVTGHGNTGFGAGCNLGAARAEGDLLLLLNPDCLIAPGTLGELARLLAGRGERWLAGVRLLNSDGTEQRGARRNRGTPHQWLAEALGLHRLGLERVNLHQHPLPETVTPVEAISGAFILVPRRFWRELGGMDERYFLHFEDLDFCLRARRAGGEVLFVPGLSAEHHKSQSRVCGLWLARQKVRGLRTFFFGHFQSDHSAAALWAAWAVLSAGLMAKSLLARLVRGA